jgi:hypothetical protein
VTALTWAKKGTVKSDIATGAAMLWRQYLVVKGTDLTGVDHLPKEINTRTDRPMWTWDLVLEDDRENYGGKLPADLRFLDLNCHRLLDICKPSVYRKRSCRLRYCQWRRQPRPKSGGKRKEKKKKKKNDTIFEDYKNKKKLPPHQLQLHAREGDDDTDEAREEVNSCLHWQERGLSEGTIDNYQRLKWLKFTTTEISTLNSHFLSKIEVARSHKVTLLVFFFKHLCIEENKRDEQASEAMSSLKGNWITAQQPTEFFDEYTENHSNAL